MPRRAQARTETRTGALPVRPELPREFVALHKRRRIMDAIAELTAEQGYDSTKIGDIVRRQASPAKRSTTTSRAKRKSSWPPSTPPSTR